MACDYIFLWLNQWQQHSGNETVATKHSVPSLSPNSAKLEPSGPDFLLQDSGFSELLLLQSHSESHSAPQSETLMECKLVESMWVSFIHIMHTLISSICVWNKRFVTTMEETWSSVSSLNSSVYSHIVKSSLRLRQTLMQCLHVHSSRFLVPHLQHILHLHRILPPYMHWIMTPHSPKLHSYTVHPWHHTCTPITSHTLV